MSKFKVVLLALICMGLAGSLTVWYWDHVVVPAPFPFNWILFFGGTGAYGVAVDTDGREA